MCFLSRLFLCSAQLAHLWFQRICCLPFTLFTYYQRCNNGRTVGTGSRGTIRTYGRVDYYCASIAPHGLPQPPAPWASTQYPADDTTQPHSALNQVRQGPPPSSPSDSDSSNTAGGGSWRAMETNLHDWTKFLSFDMETIQQVVSSQEKPLNGGEEHQEPSAVLPPFLAPQIPDQSLHTTRANGISESDGNPMPPPDTSSPSNTQIGRAHV